MALACDVRLASENAHFGQPEINLGIIPGWGATQRLARATNIGYAKELILTGRMIDATRRSSGASSSTSTRPRSSFRGRSRWPT